MEWGGDACYLGHLSAIRFFRRFPTTHLGRPLEALVRGQRVRRRPGLRRPRQRPDGHGRRGAQPPRGHDHVLRAAPRQLDQVGGLRDRWIGGRPGRGQLHLPEDHVSRGRRGFEATLPLPPPLTHGYAPAVTRFPLPPRRLSLSIEYTLRGDEAYAMYHTCYNYDTLSRQARTRCVISCSGP